MTQHIGIAMSSQFIILIENDLNLRQSIALILQRAGYTVTATDCVTKALELIRNGNYHLLISDFNIPETREIILTKVPRIISHLPILILTDQSSFEVERDSRISGAYYLLKPVAPERLIDSVGSILSKSNNSNHPINHDLYADQV